VALTPGFSVAVDPKYLPLGAPLLLSIASAAGAAAAGERLPDDLLPARLALAQDTGGAIRGPLRVDWYWGQGSGAGEIAGRQRAMGTIRLLVPRGFARKACCNEAPGRSRRLLGRFGRVRRLGQHFFEPIERNRPGCASAVDE